MKEGEPVLGGPQVSPGNVQPANPGVQPAGFETLQNTQNAQTTPLTPPTSPTFTPNVPLGETQLNNPIPQPAPVSPPAPSVQTFQQFSPQFPTQPTTPSMGDVVLSDTPPQKPKKGLIILAAVVAIILVGVLIWLLYSNSTSENAENYSEKFSTEIGKPNLDIIYDESSPIPVLEGTLYGYYSPTEAEFIMSPQFKEAERFYGNYAKVEQITDIYSVIDRSGNIILDTDSSEQIFYDVEDNYWMIDGSIYNSDMEKINPDNTLAKYLGYGYIQVMTEEFPGKVYISNEFGENVYECQANCNAVLTKDIENDTDIYAAIHTDNVGTTIIDLANEKEIYSSDTNTYLLQKDIGVFSEMNTETGDFIRYVIIKNGSVSFSLDYENNDYVTFGDGKYRILECDNETYKILHADSSEEISNCEYSDITLLPDNIYKKFELDGNNLLVVSIQDGDRLRSALLDLENKNFLDSFQEASISFINESPFILVDDGNEIKICNILASSANCITSDTSEDVEAYDNYIIIGDKMYNFRLEEIIK